MKNLRTKTVRSSGWLLGSNTFSQIVSFCYGIVLARLLVPDDFGLIAMVVAFTGLASLLSDVGLGSALVQKKDLSELHFNSVFWLNVALGCSLSALIFFSSTWISIFYGRSEVEGICQVLSFTFIISAFAMVPRTVFVKQLHFKYIAITDSISLIVSGMIAIFMAANDFGYQSLVALSLSRVTISTALIWGFSTWKPKISVSHHAIKDLLGFSSSVLGTRLLQYITKNIDKLLIGKILGGEVLGIYDKAQSMMLFPLRNISHVIGSVMFPSMSLVQSDIDRVREIYLRSTRSIALLTFPMMMGMFVVADSFVFGVLGAHWEGIIPIIRILCIAGIASSIVTVTGSLYKSQGAALLQLRVNMFTQPMRVVGVLAGLNWGVIGVAIGYTLAEILASLITLTIAGRLVNLKLTTLLFSLAPMLLPAIVMAILVFSIRLILGAGNELVLFMIQLIFGLSTYWLIIKLMKLRAYEDVKSVLREEYVSWRQSKSSN